MEIQVVLRNGLDLCYWRDTPTLTIWIIIQFTFVMSLKDHSMVFYAIYIFLPLQKIPLASDTKCSNLIG